MTVHTDSRRDRDFVGAGHGMGDTEGLGSAPGPGRAPGSRSRHCSKPALGPAAAAVAGRDGAERPDRSRLPHRASSAALLTLLALTAVGLGAARAPAQERPPIVDMHLHAWEGRWEAGAAPPNPITGRPSSALTGADLIPRTLEVMERLNIVLGVAGGDSAAVRRWVERAPERIVGSLMFPVVLPGVTPAAFPLAEASAGLRAGRLGALGEITAVYAGLAPNDPALQPFYALAEELDVPVGIHLGPGRPGIAYHPCCADHRIALSSPLQLEDVLVAHPELRVWVMHAGYPMADEMIALLWAHPRVYVDIGVLDWALPLAEFHAYLERLVRAGYGDRIMFGSDQMFWPEVIEIAVKAVESAPFLSEAQKRDIFYDNAARFLRMERLGGGAAGASREEEEARR